MSLTVTAQVQNGHKIELRVPEFEDGQVVRVTIESISKPVKDSQQQQQPTIVANGLAAWFRAIPVSNRTAEQWKEYDRELRKERDAWDRD